MKRLTIALATALALPLLLSTSAKASTLETASGTFDSTVGVTRIEHNSGNTTLYGTEIQHLTGALVGTRIATGVMIVHADGSFEAHDDGVFTGTVDGRLGTIEIDGVSKGIGNSGTGRLLFGHGTGSLSGLHGEGVFAPTFTSLTTAIGTYSADVHFEPQR